MKAPESIFLIEQEGRLTFAVARPTSPTITDDQVTEYVKAGATKPETPTDSDVTVSESFQEYKNLVLNI